MIPAFEMTSRHVLVTGASSGLGRHFAHILSAQGASVTLAARRIESLEAVAEDIRATGGDVRVVTMDVTDETSVADGFAHAETAAGPVTVLVNNAGIARTRKALDTSAEEFDAVLDTNLRGAWLAARGAASRMVEADTGGSIVNVASILAFRVAGAVMPYAVSKAGLVQMTKALALEWARYGIRVNALAPGYVETEINAGFLGSEAGEAMKRRVPMRRFGTLDELTGPLLLLASDAGSYMTGSVLTVDGGHVVSSL